MVKVLLPLDFFERKSQTTIYYLCVFLQDRFFNFFSYDDTSLRVLFCKRSKSNTNKNFCLNLDCNFNFLLNTVHIIVAIHIRLIHIRNTKKEYGRTKRCLVLFFPVSWHSWQLLTILTIDIADYTQTSLLTRMTQFCKSCLFTYTKDTFLHTYDAK